MSLSLVTGPASEPVTLDQFKTHARIIRDDDDAFSQSCIVAARQYAEAKQRRQLMPATWRLTLDAFPEWYLGIPLPPLQSITSIAYVDDNGATQTLNPSLYIVDTYREPGLIVPAYGQAWPVARFQPNAVTVVFVAGYANAAAVPDATKHAIKLLASHYYENREAVVTGTITGVLPLGVDALLSATHFGGYQ